MAADGSPIRVSEPGGLGEYRARHEAINRGIVDAEHQLRRFAAIIGAASDAIISGTPDGIIQSWNSGAERLYGYAAAEIVGRSVRALLREEDTPEVIAMRDKLLAGVPIQDFEMRQRRKDGSLVDVSVSAAPITDERGVMTATAAIVRDVSERREAERREAEWRQRFEQAFENAPIGKALVGLDGSFLAVNRAMCEFLGRSEAELRALDFQSVTHPDDVEASLRLHDRALEAPLRSQGMEERYLRPDGSVLWGKVRIASVRASDGEASYLVAQIVDITERKRTEALEFVAAGRLAELASRDPLTGLPNLPHARERLTELVASERKLSVVVFEVAHLQRINERRGRTCGDQVLRSVAAILEKLSPRDGVAARIRGDGFALILPGAGYREAQRIADRAVGAAAAHPEGIHLDWGRANVAPGHERDAAALIERARTQVKRRDRRTPTARAVEGLSDEAVESIQRVLALAREELGVDVSYMVGNGVRRPELATLAAGDESDGTPRRLSVPVQLGDGSLYGTLCAGSDTEDGELSERNACLLRFLAGSIADALERDRALRGARESAAALSGVTALLAALEARDHYTGSHSRTVVELAGAVARELGLGDHRVSEVEQVALLHDIGKVGIPDSILLKAGPLDEVEWELMRQHPAVGERIVANTPTLSHLATAIRSEHEHYDGSGYPDGLRGEEIPITSRITLACDAYHAMTSDRPYRSALSEDAARAELRAGAGGQFDPAVAEVLLRVLARRDEAALAAPPRGAEASEVA